MNLSVAVDSFVTHETITIANGENITIENEVFNGIDGISLKIITVINSINITIMNNVFDNLEPVSTSDVIIALIQDSSNITIVNNQISNNYGSSHLFKFIEVSNSTNVHIANNVVRASTNNFEFIGFDISESSNVVIDNNTISLDNINNQRVDHLLGDNLTNLNISRNTFEGTSLLSTSGLTLTNIVNFHISNNSFYTDPQTNQLIYLSNSKDGYLLIEPGFAHQSVITLNYLHNSFIEYYYTDFNSTLILDYSSNTNLSIHTSVSVDDINFTDFISISNNQNLRIVYHNSTFQETIYGLDILALPKGSSGNSLLSFNIHSWLNSTYTITFWRDKIDFIYIGMFFSVNESMRIDFDFHNSYTNTYNLTIEFSSNNFNNSHVSNFYNLLIVGHIVNIDSNSDRSQSMTDNENNYVLGFVIMFILISLSLIGSSIYYYKIVIDSKFRVGRDKSSL